MDLSQPPETRGLNPKLLPKDVQVQEAQKAQAALEAVAAPSNHPPVPSHVPVVGDRVNFVLRKLGSGVVAPDQKTPQRKIRPAIVTEDWREEKHPVLAWKGIGLQPTVRGHDGKPILHPETKKPVVPVGTVNLEIHLDGHARRDFNDGHLKYEGHVLYDPVEKRPGTWHWPTD